MQIGSSRPRWTDRTLFSATYQSPRSYSTAIQVNIIFEIKSKRIDINDADKTSGYHDVRRPDTVAERTSGGNSSTTGRAPQQRCACPAGPPGQMGSPGNLFLSLRVANKSFPFEILFMDARRSHGSDRNSRIAGQRRT